MSMKPFLKTLSGAAAKEETGKTKPTDSQPVPPIWLMRQAGRYLPEYRALRETAGGFLDLCYNPVFAEEVTLQPIRRYGFDAAILFADILLIPDALGQKVWFETGEGPRLDPVVSAQSLSLDKVSEHLEPIIETVSRLSHSLPKETTLIGFAGAPWTVATYMVAGRGTPDQAPARALAQNDPQAFQGLMDIIVAATIDYLAAQVEAGAEVLQLFESWAASLLGEEFDMWCVAPVAAIVEGLRARGVGVPIIGFPRAASCDMADYVARTGVQVLGLDTSADRKAMVQNVPENIVLQGNLDPLTLVAGGAALEQAVADIKNDFAGRDYIFNLGHGIVPQTPPENVQKLIELVRQG